MVDKPTSPHEIQVVNDPPVQIEKPKWSNKALMILGAGILVGLAGSVMAFAPHHMGSWIDHHAHFSSWATKVPIGVQYTMVGIGAGSIFVLGIGTLARSDRVRRIQWFGRTVDLGKRLEQSIEIQDKKKITQLQDQAQQYSNTRQTLSDQFLMKYKNNSAATSYANQWKNEHRADLLLQERARLEEEEKRLNPAKQLSTSAASLSNLDQPHTLAAREQAANAFTTQYSDTKNTEYAEQWKQVTDLPTLNIELQRLKITINQAQRQKAQSSNANRTKQLSAQADQLSAQSKLIDRLIQLQTGIDSPHSLTPMKSKSEQPKTEKAERAALFYCRDQKAFIQSLIDQIYQQQANVSNRSVWDDPY